MEVDGYPWDVLSYSGCRQEGETLGPGFQDGGDQAHSRMPEGLARCSAVSIPNCPVPFFCPLLLVLDVGQKTGPRRELEVGFLQKGSSMATGKAKGWQVRVAAVARHTEGWEQTGWDST